MGAPWGRFFVLWFSCCLATGVIPGSALFINIFSDAGVYRSVCKSVEDTCRDQYLILSGIFNVGGTLSVVFLCPIGMVYDCWGARFAGCVGALFCALGLALITVSLWGSQAGYDDKTGYAFIIGVFVCDFGALLNSFSFMGLIWHFPGRQSLILALINATYQVSALTPIVINWLLVYFDLVMIMVVFTGMVCLTTWVCWACVPSKEEFYREAKRVLGMPLPRPDTRGGCCEMMRRSWRVLRMEPVDHIVSGAAFTAAFAFPTFYSSTTALYGEVLFGREEDGERLGVLYVSLTAVIGALLAPAAGWLADCLGISMFILILACTQLLGTATCGLASWVAQTISCSCQILVMSALQLLISRYLLQYAPPNRIGTVQGIYCMLLSPAELALVLPLLAWYRSLGHDVNALRLPMCTAGGLSTASMYFYAWYYWRYPPPEVPELLPEDESELAMAFGCKSLEEVMEIVHLESRSELLELMASTSPKDMHKLISMIDVGQLMLVMKRHSVEDLANMLENFAAEEADAEESGSDSEDGSTVPLLVREADSDDELRGRLVVRPEESRRDVPIGVSTKVENLTKMQLDGDKNGILKYYLTEPIDSVMEVAGAASAIYTPAELTQIEKRASRLVSGKDWADLLRERSELRGYIQQMMRTHLEQKVWESSKELVDTDYETTLSSSESDSDGTASSSSSDLKVSMCCVLVMPVG